MPQLSIKKFKIQRLVFLPRVKSRIFVWVSAVSCSIS